MPENDLSSVVPAQLSYLAVYNPLLGRTDETIDEQVVFYTSRSSILRRYESSPSGNGDKSSSNHEKNERLRQIGLAQGMVRFASNFSEGKAVDFVETERSQIVLHELEKDWWILASIDLTRLPTDHTNSSSTRRDASETPSFHYSSREVSPPHLLIQQLRRAHSLFLLHHASTLDELYERVGRSTFCIVLEDFWLRFAWTWEVLLGGNPAADIYNGIKLSAGGELGVGVGEEEWGSGEREVLEDFVARTDGLVDLVVSRFGDPYTPNENPGSDKKQEEPTDTLEGENQWLGSDTSPRPSDGIIFSGVGGIARPCLVQVSQWMECVYRYGFDAYGVGQDPTSPRRRKRRKRQRGRTSERNYDRSAATDSTQGTNPERPFTPGIPRPIVQGTVQAPQSTQQPGAKGRSPTTGESSPSPSDRSDDWMNVGVGTDTFVKYLTLGYGSSWSFSSGVSSPHPRVEALKREDGSTRLESPAKPPPDPHEPTKQALPQAKTTFCYKSGGRFIIGLHEGTDSSEGVLEDTEPANSAASSSERILKRTVHVHLTNPPKHNSTVGLRVVVYMNKPFIYTFLFEAATPSLADASLYHSIHHQLGPLQKPLSNSTSPANAAARILTTEHTLDVNRHFSPKNSPVYDLVYDPSNLTIRSSIPNIPDLRSPFPEPSQTSRDHPLLSRVESINIHHRLLSTYIETRSRHLEVERTCKTSRGWWIVWVRMSSKPKNNNTNRSKSTSSASSNSNFIPPANALNTNPLATDPDTRQEAFLVRKASDHVPSSTHGRSSSSSRFFRDLGGASSPSRGTDTGPGKLVEGLGLDARRYIENLLSLNR